jgi:hypothetical protein
MPWSSSPCLSRNTPSLAARHHGIAVLGGPIVRDPTNHKRHNTALVLDARGDLVATYRKVHIPDRVSGRPSTTTKGARERAEAALPGYSPSHCLRAPVPAFAWDPTGRIDPLSLADSPQEWMFLWQERGHSKTPSPLLLERSKLPPPRHSSHVASAGKHVLMAKTGGGWPVGCTHHTKHPPRTDK